MEASLDIRKFEIELYWKRAAYFWGLIALTFIGYFSIYDDHKDGSILLFLLGCIGVILSLAWHLVNLGSKYWQENWEAHVDRLEDEHNGPLYKTILSKEKLPSVLKFSILGF